MEEEKKSSFEITYFRNEKLAQISKTTSSLWFSIYSKKAWKGLFKVYERYVPFIYI